MQKLISILINLRYMYLQLKLLKNKQNNKKICDIFHHNFKNILCYVTSEGIVETVLSALFDNGLTLKTLELVYSDFCIQTLYLQNCSGAIKNYSIKDIV